MKTIDQTILENLLKCVEIFKNKIALGEFTKACQCIEEMRPNYYNWEDLSHDLSSSSKWLEFNTDLKNCLIFKLHAELATFDEIRAYAHLIPTQQQFAIANTIDLLSDVEPPGIQEKYLSGELTEQVSLTELDIQRFIVATGMVGKIVNVRIPGRVYQYDENRVARPFYYEEQGVYGGIQVTNLDPTKIGMILNRQKISIKPEDSTTTYAVTMMIHLDPKPGQDSVRWLSVIVTINPETQKIHYKINCEDPISQQERAGISKIIEQGIRFAGIKTGRLTTVYEAFPDPAMSVSFEFIKLSETAPQNLGGAGFKVLHLLYQDEALSEVVNYNNLAKEFKDLKNPWEVKRFVYDLEVQNIEIPSDVQELLDKHINSNLNINVSISRKFEELLSFFDASAAAFTGVVSVHPLIRTKLAELKPLDDIKLTFPGEQSDPAVTSVDFERLLLLVQNKFHSVFENSVSKKTLNEIVLTCYDDGVAALQGLVAYSGYTLPFPAKCLVLDLNELQLIDDESRAKFMDNLNLVLTKLPKSQLAALRFIDDKKQLDDEMIDTLTKTISANQIAIEITLPERLQTSPMQKELDYLVSNTIREQRIASWSKKTIAAPQQIQAIDAPIRTRHLAGKQNLEVSIELQQDQEQQVSVVRATEHERTRKNEVFSTASGDEIIYGVDQFRRAVSETKSHTDIFSMIVKDEVDNLWVNWVGAISIFEARAKRCLLLSKSACQELVRHRDKFQFGLDLNNLPPGFTLEKLNAEASYIQFNENRRIFSKYDPLQVQLAELPGETPLANTQFKTWLANTRNLRSSNQTIDIIHAVYEQLNSKTYNRNADQLFKQYLPQMLLLDAEQLGRLFNITMSEQGLAVEKFQFLLDVTRAKKSKGDNKEVKHGYDHGDDIAMAGFQSRLMLLFPNFSGNELNEFNLAIDFFDKYHEQQLPFPEHLLGQLVQDEGPLKGKIEQLIARLPQINLNALLQVYIQLGEQGIASFIALVDSDPSPDKSLFNELYAKVFVNTKSHMPLLDDAYIEAMNTIQKFTSEARLWWDTLLTQHCAAQHDVNLLDLVEAFKKFSEELKKLPTHDGSTLVFPPVCKLKDVKSLPTALSRILSILKHAKEQDRVRQWQVVDELDLSSNGCIKAIAAKGLQQWAFIVPEMEINADAEYKIAMKDNKTSPVSYAVSTYSQLFDERKPLAVFARNFFRYVAYGGENAQLPLEFYQYVHRTLTNPPEFLLSLSDKEKKYLYMLITHATAKEEYVSTIPTLADAIAMFDKLLKVIELKDPARIVTSKLKNTGETPRSALLKSTLRTLKIIPPLPVLLQLVTMVSTAMQSGSLSLAAKKGRLEDANSALKNYLGRYKTAVYEGMKWYGEADYSKDADLYFRYLERVKTIADLFPEKPPNNIVNNEQACHLIRMISLFQLAPKDIIDLYDKFFKGAILAHPEFLIQALKALDILRKIRPPEARFVVADLELILAAVKSASAENKSVIAVLREVRLSNGELAASYFPQGYLENYGKEAISAEVNGNIKKFFTEAQQKLIKKILARFSEQDDFEHHALIVNKLILICQKLSETQKSKFINILAGSADLYTNPQLLSDPLNYFVRMLEAIRALDAPNEFLHFMACTQDLLASSSNEQRQQPDWIVGDLAQKADLYLRTNWQLIQEIPNFTLFRLELAPRFIELILKTPMNEIIKDNYDRLCVSLCTTINKLVLNNPNSKTAFLELLDQYLQDFSPAANDAQTTSAFAYLSEFVYCLKKHFDQIKDKNLVLSLCLQFNGKINGDLKLVDLRRPADLLKMLRFIETLPPAYQPIVLKIAVELINNEKEYTLENLQRLYLPLIDLKLGPQLATALEEIYKKAPIPTIAQVVDWHDHASSNLDDSDADITEADITKAYAIKMSNAYKDFSLHPCHREPKNAFDVAKANAQLAQFEGLTAENSIDAFLLQTEIKATQDKTPTELLEILHSFKDKELSDEDYYKLVAVAAELLYRSKGKDDKDDEGIDIAGSSMEINTTQYLAILSLLKTPGHVTSKIGTGEGKTRIMMISLACQHALGNTIDFVTADIQLAERDFVEYKSYFDMIGAETSLILANSDESEYKQGGIHFSDPQNLSLFRNKARSEGRGDEVIDPRLEKRALFLDEADRAYFDMRNTRFNFSKEGDKTIVGVQWIYPLLMAYYAQDKVALTTPVDGQFTISPFMLHHKNVDLSREDFKKFAYNNCTQIQQQRLKEISDAQIEQWQESAVIANGLQYKRDFAIGRDERISTAAGIQLASEAQVIFKNRVIKGATYSFGVHQCLQARLEYARQHLDTVHNEQLRTELSECRHEFYIPDEKQIVYSSSNKNLLDDYRRGPLKAVTGTPGTESEKEEAAVFYGLSVNDQYIPMSFIEVPRHEGLNRIDKEVMLVADAAAQLNAFVGNIRAARAKNQPILVIAENDQESEYLFEKLNEVFKDNIQHIHSQLSTTEENTRVSKAGQPQQITVSTGMIGRGTDIRLKGEARDKGLNVMVTYLPESRELEQIIGRSGRFGAKGETQLILDKLRTEKELGKKLSEDNWLGVEAGFTTHINRLQIIRDRKIQGEGLITDTEDSFITQLKNWFFDPRKKEIKRDDFSKLDLLWSVFDNDTTKEWNKLWPQLQEAVGQDPVDIAGIENLLATYRSKVQHSWNKLHRAVNDLSLVCIDEKTNPVTLLPEVVPELILAEATKAILTKTPLVVPVVPVVQEVDVEAEIGDVLFESRVEPPPVEPRTAIAHPRAPDAPPNARAPKAFAPLSWWRHPLASFRASSNKGKITGAIGFGLLGAAVGAALTATGVLAPLGIVIGGIGVLATSIAIFAAIGFAVGSLFGFGGGAIVDAKAKRSRPREEEEIDGMDRSPGSSKVLARLSDSKVVPEVVAPKVASPKVPDADLGVGAPKKVNAVHQIDSDEEDATADTPVLEENHSAVDSDDYHDDDNNKSPVIHRPPRVSSKPFRRSSSVSSDDSLPLDEPYQAKTEGEQPKKSFDEDNKGHDSDYNKRPD